MISQNVRPRPLLLGEIFFLTKRRQKGYEALQEQKNLLESLPEQIAAADALAADLRAAHPSPAPDLPRNMTLALPATLALVADRRAHLDRTRARVAALRDGALPAAREELGGLEEELRELVGRKDEAVGRAREARARAERGGGGVGEVERRGRWARAGEGLMRGVLEGEA